MESTASTTDVPTCDICRKRDRRNESVCQCLECELSLCEDCTFTHSWIPSCQSHTTIPAGEEDPKVVLYQGIRTEEDKVDAPQLELKSKFSPAREEDEVNPNIRAVLLLECGVILATDWANCTLKSFDMDGRFLGDCLFDQFDRKAGRVHGLAFKDSKTVYATLPAQNMIACISFELINDCVEFSTPTLHETERRYHGIAHMARSKTLIVGTTNTVDILSYQFEVVCKLEQFSNPYNIGVESPGSVLVSDTMDNCLYRISAEKKVERIDVAKKKKSLRGVTVDGRENIFFAAEMSSGIGWARGCRMMGWLLTDRVQQAVGVHYQTTDTGHWLVVSEKDGTIKLFRIK